MAKKTCETNMAWWVSAIGEMTMIIILGGCALSFFPAKLFEFQAVMAALQGQLKNYNTN